MYKFKQILFFGSVVLMKDAKSRSFSIMIESRKYLNITTLLIMNLSAKLKKKSNSIGILFLMNT